MPAETRTCPVCWTPFTAAGRRIYCSKKCCGTAWERRGGRQTRSATAATSTPSPAPRPVTTTGCPHCGQPVTIVALLATPQAARPHLPSTTQLRPIRPV